MGIDSILTTLFVGLEGVCPQPGEGGKTWTHRKKLVKIANAEFIYTKLESRLAGDGRGVVAFIISALTRACNTASDPGVHAAKNLGVTLSREDSGYVTPSAAAELDKTPTNLTLSKYF